MINYLKDFFGFSKKELNGLLVFCLLIFSATVAPIIYPYFIPQEKYDYSAFSKEIENFRASAKIKHAYYKPYTYTYNKAEDKARVPQLFSFDPNGLSVALWQKLGLSDRQIKVIKNFESKGGKFYRKEDLQKIYSIKEQDYAMLEPYIEIPTQGYSRNKPLFEKRATDYKTIKIIELNTADSISLESLNGIGPAFASRIIKYRNRLGGFHRKEQLREVYGIDSAVYQKLESQFTVNPISIQPVLINTATVEILKKSPYLNYKQINAIIQYRKQHGSYKNLADLKKVLILNDEILAKLQPYISFD